MNNSIVAIKCIAGFLMASISRENSPTSLYWPFSASCQSCWVYYDSPRSQRQVLAHLLEWDQILFPLPSKYTPQGLLQQQDQEEIHDQCGEIQELGHFVEPMSMYRITWNTQILCAYEKRLSIVKCTHSLFHAICWPIPTFAQSLIIPWHLKQKKKTENVYCKLLHYVV